MVSEIRVLEQVKVLVVLVEGERRGAEVLMYM
jgi:hypothetical protein